MADQETTELLISWELPDLIYNFSKHKVNIRALKCMKPGCKIIETLIPEAGDRAIFEFHLTQFLDYPTPDDSLKNTILEEKNETSENYNSLNLSNKTSSNLMDLESLETVTGNSSTIGSGTVAVRIIATADDDGIKVCTDSSNVPEVSNSEFVEELNSAVESLNKHVDRKAFYDNLRNLDLETLLNGSINGQIVLGTYKLQGYLDDSAYVRFMNTLANEMLSCVYTFKTLYECTNEHFEELADKVIALFPREKKRIYYIAPKAESEKQLVSKGKIPDIYRNTLTKLRKLFIVPSKRKRVDFEESEVILTEDLDEQTLKTCQDNLEWLKCNSAPWSEVEEHWAGSRALRLRTLETFTGDVHDIFKLWPVLKQPRGYELMVSDYMYKFKNGNNLFQGWPQLSTKLHDVMKTRLKAAPYASLIKYTEAVECTPDARDAILFSLIPALCPLRKALALPGARKPWKPSVAESTDSFILHVEIPGQLLKAIEDLKTRLQSKGLTFQPLVIIVGKSLTNIESSYVLINDTRYLMGSVIKAVDTCYKIFHILNACYPKECEQAWLILQHCAYKYKQNEEIITGKLLNIESMLTM